MAVFEKNPIVDSPRPDPRKNPVDRQAEFVGLLGQNYRALYACAVSLGADLHQADDIMQEVSILLWQQFDQFESGTSFVRWGRAMVRNVFRNQRRSQWHRKHVFNPLLIEKLFEMHCGAEELLEIRVLALQRCLKKLSGSDRKLIDEFYNKRQTLADKAAGMGRTANSLHKAISRIRLRLSECIDRQLGADCD